MKIIFALLLFAVLGGLFLRPLQPKLGGTRLQMDAHWEDGTAVKGTVTVQAVESGGLDAIIDRKPLANGTAKLKTPATGNCVSVTVRDESARQLAKFPIHQSRGISRAR